MTSCSLTRIGGLLRVRVTGESHKSSYRSFAVSPRISLLSLTLWYIGKRKQGFLRNHAIPQFTFLTPVGNRCITPCVCVKEPSRAREVIPTAGGLYVHKGTVFCRNIRRR